MAITDLIGAQTCTEQQGMSPADIAGHEAGSHVRTEPLSPAAAAAMARIEYALLPADVVRAVTCYETAALRYDELMRRPLAGLSPAEVDAIKLAQEVMAESFGVLAEAGQINLTAPVEFAAGYLHAAHHCQQLAADADDFDAIADVQDEMAMFRRELAKAGRLDLIGAA